MSYCILKSCLNKFGWRFLKIQYWVGLLVIYELWKSSVVFISNSNTHEQSRPKRYFYKMKFI